MPVTESKQKRSKRSFEDNMALGGDKENGGMVSTNQRAPPRNRARRQAGMQQVTPLEEAKKGKKVRVRQV